MILLCPLVYIRAHIVYVIAERFVLTRLSNDHKYYVSPSLPISCFYGPFRLKNDIGTGIHNMIIHYNCTIGSILLHSLLFADLPSLSPFSLAGQTLTRGERVWYTGRLVLTPTTTGWALNGYIYISSCCFDNSQTRSRCAVSTGNAYLVIKTHLTPTLFCQLSVR